ncbi:unnamed protein product [Clonostachys rosea f. rosea IK726]|uniref:Uncharacterized protein n=1 Tax=Clonostachys rosea f. rosea IK726 TaxID=1349383 RepID=A0ACA9UT17_BIOOC|nr:unnamed protein product [Clonostachys rosea f. rosea IK726]
MRSSWIVALAGLIAPLVHAAPSTPPELEVRACIPQGGPPGQCCDNVPCLWYPSGHKACAVRS